MKFVRGLTTVSILAASVPLAIACGSASDHLFSESGGAPSFGGESAQTTGGESANDAGATSSAGGASSNQAGSSSVADAGNGSSGSDAVAGSTGAGAPNGGAATAGSAGSPAGGSAPAGGSGGALSAGSGGSGALGGDASAGSGGVTAGSSGAGTGAAGGPGCPPSVPKAGNACMATTPESCFYPGIACSCLSGMFGGGGPGQGGGRKWACYGTPDLCPDQRPVAGEACKAGAECPYPGSDFCACVGFGNQAHWACQPEQPTCPNKPNQNFACSNVRSCSYLDVACFCNGTSWGCEGG